MILWCVCVSELTEVSSGHPDSCPQSVVLIRDLRLLSLSLSRSLSLSPFLTLSLSIGDSTCYCADFQFKCRKTETISPEFLLVTTTSNNNSSSRKCCSSPSHCWLACQVCLCPPHPPHTLVVTVSGNMFVADAIFFVFGRNSFRSNHS